MPECWREKLPFVKEAPIDAADTKKSKKAKGKVDGGAAKSPVAEMNGVTKATGDMKITDSKGNAGAQPPSCRFVNVELAKSTRRGTVLLENPAGEFPISYSDLLTQVQVVFDLQASKLTLSFDAAGSDEVKDKVNVAALHGRHLYVHAL